MAPIWSLNGPSTGWSWDSAACPFTMTIGAVVGSGSGGVASRTSPPFLSGTCNDSILRLAGRVGADSWTGEKWFTVCVDWGTGSWEAGGAGGPGGAVLSVETAVDVLVMGLLVGAAVEVLDRLSLSVVEDGNLKAGPSDAGNAENGPSTLAPRLIGGLPLVLPVAPMPPLRQADETTLAPCRLLADLAFEGVRADLGSSAQKAFLVEGVIADCGIGYADIGVCTISFPQVGADGFSLEGSGTGGNKKTLPLPSGCAVHGSAALPCPPVPSSSACGEGRWECDLPVSSSSGFRRPLRGLIWGRRARKAMSSSAATPSRSDSATGTCSGGISVQYGDCRPIRYSKKASICMECIHLLLWR
jgi:hypothetical protein